MKSNCLKWFVHQLKRYKFNVEIPTKLDQEDKNLF